MRELDKYEARELERHEAEMADRKRGVQIRDEAHAQYMRDSENNIESRRAHAERHQRHIDLCEREVKALESIERLLSKMLSAGAKP